MNFFAGHTQRAQEARGGVIANTMATTSNAALQKKRHRFFGSLFTKQTTTPTTRVYFAKSCAQQ